MPASLNRAARGAKITCIVLICAELIAFVVTLLMAIAQSPLVRPTGFVVFYVAGLSAIVGFAFGLYGLLYRVAEYWKWGAVVLAINVIPWIVLVVLGSIAGLP